MCAANGQFSGPGGKADKIEIEILQDGTIKVITDPVSGANHANAEQFLRMMATYAGGDTTRVKKTASHTHQHQHQHEKA